MGDYSVEFLVTRIIVVLLLLVYIFILHINVTIINKMNNVLLYTLLVSEKENNVGE